MDDIQVISIKKVTHKFGVKNFAQYRIYEYLAPPLIFVPENKQMTFEEILERVQAMCKQFEGTHNFHNYSTKIEATDPAAKRYVISMKAEKFECQPGIPFVKFIITGQSFIYHQIRKMIGSISQTIHLGRENSYIENTFYRNKVKIWLAPSEGLMLREVTKIVKQTLDWF